MKSTKSTKELARELGLLRKRASASSGSGRQHKMPKRHAAVCQKFSYVIVIDFESTCWKDKKNSSQEIIEFPAVLLNTATGQLEAEFQHYVMPDESPILSDFCKELTGITQEQVDNGIPLFICLNKFANWLKKIEVDKNVAYNSATDNTKKLCTFVTWSDWDLSVCLHYECQRKQLYKPSALNHWIDARAVYKNFYQRRPKGLNGALQEVGIEFAGRQHSGLDDSKNTARLVWRMIQDGCQLNITKTLKAGKPTAVPSALASMRPFRVGSASSTSSSSSIPASDTVLKLPSSAACVTLATTPSTKEGVGSSAAPSVRKETEIGPSCLFSIYEDSTEISNVKGSPRSGLSSGNASKSVRTSSKPESMPLKEQSASPGSEIVTCIGGGDGVGTVLCNVDRNHTRSCGTVQEETCNNQCNIKPGGVFKTPPHCPTPFFNQNSITKYGKSGVKTPVDDKFRTPLANRTSSSSKASPDGFKTPPSMDTPGSCAKITPPMCECGRRSKRRVTVRPGPNQGRPFYSCPGQRRGSSAGLKDATNAKMGCRFFSWESSVISGLYSPSSATGLPTPQSARKPRTPSPLAMGSIQKTIQQRSSNVTPLASMQNVIQQRTGQRTSGNIYRGVTPIGIKHTNSWR